MTPWRLDIGYAIQMSYHTTPLSDGYMTGDDIEGVLFDLDGTICTYRRSTADLLAAVHEAVGVDRFITEAEYLDQFARFTGESDSMPDLREQCFVAIARAKDRDPNVARTMARVYSDRRDHRNVRPLSGAVRAVETVAQDYPVGLVTNGSPGMQRQKLEALGIDDTFDVTVFAGYSGVAAKPSPEPFRHAVEELELDPDRTVHVGNSLQADVVGARAAGLRTVLLAPDSDSGPGPAPGPDPDSEADGDLTAVPRPDHRIETMPELLTLPWSAVAPSE